MDELVGDCNEVGYARPCMDCCVGRLIEEMMMERNIVGV
jgi:hypothetical protein